MIILAFETSHDDTSIAIVDFNGSKPEVKIEKNLTQADFFADFGGTIPELASRYHTQNIIRLLDEVKQEYDLNKVTHVAYTKEPGLIGALQLGFLAASATALALNIPLIAVNHLHGHFYAGEIVKEYKYPALGVIVSGGHSQFMYTQSPLEFEILGSTQDDAIGELFDKIANKAKLGLPGGPKIDALCQSIDESKLIKFNMVKIEGQYDLSFSGWKSKTIQLLDKVSDFSERKVIICSLQKESVNQIISTVQKILTNYTVNTLVIGGGVAANTLLRKSIMDLHPNVIIPPQKYATDNAVMIALAAYQQIREKSEQ